jgi:putative acetyltransferase
MSAPPQITIRAMRETDVAACTAIRNLPGVRWGTLARPYESVAYWKEQSAGRAAPNRFLVACVGEEVVGQISLHPMKSPRRAHVASIGICVHDDWWGLGIGTALFTALLDLADNWLGLKRLELLVYTDNAPAIALYRKFGFEVEATLRAETFRDGKFVDSYQMARLRGDLPRDTAPYPAPPPRLPSVAFTLRAAEPEDAEAVAEMMAQPLVRHGSMALPFCTPDNMGWALEAVPGGQAITAVCEGKLVGLARLDPGKGRRAHTGYVWLLAVHDAYHGHGIGTVLLTALLDVADNWLNLSRLSLHVFADNAPALALYERYGFVREGTARHDGFRAGAYADATIMARFRPGA